MTKPARLFFFFAFLPVVMTGCALHARPLAQVPIAAGLRVQASQRTQKTILLLPFEDLRGDRYIKLAPSNFIPVVHLFHDARDSYYPEQHMLRNEFEGYVLTGSVASALPVILGNAIRTMGLTNTAISDAWSAEQRDYDYVLVGRVKRTHFRDDHDGILDLILGPLGVPTGAAHYDFEYEITLLDGHDRKRVLLTRDYHFHDKRTLGWWYNRNWAFHMFMRGLDATVPTVVSDLAMAMAGDVPAPTPAPNPAMPSPEAPQQTPAPGVSH